MQDDNYAWDLL